ncbi:unnamed protein product [Caenorhabditis auriculariae]|uniref:Uncharacterized protein n=1 Tax=Caenorhabditis auriculariae TaxID=2777116 RepID=A0A8S1H136_9PELO|nr:unnamed protein product [Caenorhabditis auriculariae]
MKTYQLIDAMLKTHEQLGPKRRSTTKSCLLQLSNWIRKEETNSSSLVVEDEASQRDHPQTSDTFAIFHTHTITYFSSAEKF